MVDRPDLSEAIEPLLNRRWKTRILDDTDTAEAVNDRLRFTSLGKE
jgi:hypothetical protein